MHPAPLVRLAFDVARRVRLLGFEGARDTMALPTGVEGEALWEMVTRILEEWRKQEVEALTRPRT